MRPNISTQHKIDKQSQTKRLYIGRSGVEGEGLFTTGHIDSGSEIFKVLGHLIEHPYSKDFAAEGPNWIGAKDQTWMVPQNHNPIHYLNHCCTPNCYITETFVVAAMRDIHPHEELFIDYSTTEIDPYWSMPCECGSKTCRKTIVSFQKLPLEMQLKYYQYLPSRLAKAIRD